MFQFLGLDGPLLLDMEACQAKAFSITSRSIRATQRIWSRGIVQVTLLIPEYIKRVIEYISGDT